jgi:hypothetical protein
MQEPPEPPSWLSDYKEIDVHPDNLHSFAGVVDEELEGNFRPHTHRLFNTYASGVPFGANNPSGEVHAAKVRYHECLTAVTETMSAYINASTILVRAITEIARRYSDSDAAAQANVQAADQAFEQAIVDATAASRVPQRGTVRYE